MLDTEFATTASNLELAAYWAPQIYQDVNADLGVRADLLRTSTMMVTILHLITGKILTNLKKKVTCITKYQKHLLITSLSMIYSMQGTMRIQDRLTRMKMIWKVCFLSSKKMDLSTELPVDGDDGA